MLRFIFGVDTWRDLYSVLSVSFLFCLPTIAGSLNVYFFKVEKMRNFSYCFFVSWLPILAFLVLTLAMVWDGWACWIIVLPLFLFSESIGVLIGG